LPKSTLVRRKHSNEGNPAGSPTSDAALEPLVLLDGLVEYLLCLLASLQGGFESYLNGLKLPCLGLDLSLETTASNFTQRKRRAADDALGVHQSMFKSGSKLWYVVSTRLADVGGQ
jgi:hypothetical protein